MALLHDVLKLFELSYTRLRQKCEDLYQDEERAMEDMIRKELSSVPSSLLEEAFMSARACSPTGVCELLKVDTEGFVRLKKGFTVEKLLLASDSRVQTATSEDCNEWYHRIVSPQARVEEIFNRSPDHEACMVVDTEGRIYRSETRNTAFFLSGTFEFNVWLANYLLYDLSSVSGEVTSQNLPYWFSNLPRTLDYVG